LTIARLRRSIGTPKIPILSRLRRFDRIALAGKSPGGLEGLFPGHPPRDRAPAGIVVEGELPDDRAVFGPDLEAIGVLDDFHGAIKALSGTFGKSPMGWVRAEREPLPIAGKLAGDSPTSVWVGGKTGV
jgi:hypothetical protein